MRPFLALALLSVLGAVPGCTSGSAAEQLVGTWSLDPEAMKSSDDYKNASPEQKQFAEMMFAQMKMDLTFTQTEIRTEIDMMGQKESESTPYTVKSENGKSLVLATKDGEGMPEEITVVVEAKTLTFHSPDGKFTLRRKE